MLQTLLLIVLSIFLIDDKPGFMTPEILWKLGRVNPVGISKDGKEVIYNVNTPDILQNKTISQQYSIPITGGIAKVLKNSHDLVYDKSISPDGKYKLDVKEVKILKVQGKEFYPELDKSNVQIYDTLNYRNWDKWEDGLYSHLFIFPIVKKKIHGAGKDIISNEIYDCDEQDFSWGADSNTIIYVAKKKFGTDSTKSTNTDIYEYNISTGKTINLTDGLMGYDKAPAFSSTNILAWLSMKRDGFEADKNDILVGRPGEHINLTEHWDGTVETFLWSNDGGTIFFTAAINGTVQLFKVDYSRPAKKNPEIKQLTNGEFDINKIIGQSGDTLVVTRTDMNHASELYTFDLKTSELKQLTHVNDSVFEKLNLSKVEKRMVPTTDGKEMLVYVIYPPNFNPSKQYPTILYAQGGPQAPLTQSYSYRWNFQLMAANDYIVIAPNRRGMPGHGVKWNEQISKDNGGQVMDDYLSAVDALSKEPFVDKTKIACVGPSYGGYSVFYLAGIHNNRFKTFISHNGIFNLKSFYGSTDELFFVDWEYGGPYWDVSNAAAQKTYSKFDPSNLVAKWNTPILIFTGGKDYRVPETQSFEAFQAAQLRGIKSRIIYFPNENHWVLSPQNSIIWQREFFKWLKETLL